MGDLVLGIVIAVLLLGSLAAFVLFAARPVWKLLRESRHPGLTVRDEDGKAHWSGTLDAEALEKARRHRVDERPGR